jgi:hypothetical protein
MRELVRRWFAIPWLTRCAIGLWLALILGVSGRVLASSVTSQSVIPIYQVAGERWLRGEPLYPPIPGMDIYRNPPGFALLFVPPIGWNAKVVAVVWRILGIAAFAFGLWQWWGRWPEPRRSLGFMVAALLILPAFNNGQVNVLMAASAVGAFAAIQRQRWWQAAFWLAFGIGLKLYPIAVAGLAVLIALRQLTLRTVCLTLAILAVPFAFARPQYVVSQYQDFWHYAQLDDRSAEGLDRAPRDWTILVRTGIDEIVPRTISQSVAAGFGLAMALVVWWTRKGRPATFALGLSLIWMTLFGPATESNTYSILAPVGFIVLELRSRWARLLGWLAMGFLSCAVVRGTFPQEWGYLLIGAQPLGASLLLLAMMIPQRSAPSS